MILLLYILPLIGITQVLGFFIRYFILTQRSATYQQNLQKYGKLLLIYGVAFLGFHMLDVWRYDFATFTFILFIPTCMAVYYWYIVYSRYDDLKIDEL